jgi:hypothetical protein
MMKSKSQNYAAAMGGNSKRSGASLSAQNITKRLQDAQSRCSAYDALGRVAGVEAAQQAMVTRW